MFKIIMLMKLDVYFTYAYAKVHVYINNNLSKRIRILSGGITFSVHTKGVYIAIRR